MHGLNNAALRYDRPKSREEETLYIVKPLSNRAFQRGFLPCAGPKRGEKPKPMTALESNAAHSPACASADRLVNV